MNRPVTLMPRISPMFLSTLLVILISVSILCGLGIAHTLTDEQGQESARLQAIADLQARQIADWLRERRGNAEIVRTSPDLPEEYEHWRNGGDADATARMQTRLARYLMPGSFGAIRFYGADGRLIWSTLEPPAQDTAPALAAGLREAGRMRQVQRVGPYLDAAQRSHLDYVVPLAAATGPPAIVVLHAEPTDWLYPTLQTWPSPTATGESFLFRRDGDQVLYLNPLRHRPDAPLSLRLPLASQDLLAARLLRGSEREGAVMQGVDYRGVRVLGVARAIAGTDWFVVAKLDLDEIYAQCRGEIALIVLAGLLTFLIAGATPLVVRHRQQVALASATQEAQAERLAALERLQASEQRFLATFEQAAVGIALVAPDGRWLRVNRRLCEILGYAESELLDKTFQDITHPDDLTSDLGYVRQMLAGEIAHYALEKRYIRKDGEPLWITLTVALVRQDDGAPDYFISVVEDISARKAAEAALRASQRFLHTVLDTIPDLVWLKDPDGVYLACNSRFQALFGASEAAILGRTDRDFVDPELADRFRANDLAAIAAGHACVNEEELVFASDGYRELAQTIKTPMVDAAGTLIGVLGIARDITQLKAAEQELTRHRDHLEEVVAERTADLEAARAEAERLARTKGEFLANMSHEIRTPMNAVLGLAYLLERQELPEEARDLARKIQQSGRSLLGIINDILDFSKIESGRVTIEHIPFRLGEVLDNLATILRTSTADKAIELVIRPPAGPDPVLMGDPLRLGQILINLASNAIKFTPAGLVEVRSDPIAQSASRISLRFAVRDTGIGIDAETQARLFRPFTQADASTTRRFGGTGLGLVICRCMAELMGGRLGLESTPGTGSTFWLELTFDLAEPGQARGCQASARPLPDTDGSPAEQLHGIRLLVVDDSEINCEVAQLIFAAAGAEVQLLNDGQAAVDWLTAHPDAVDLVLMDVHMPVMDGRTATRLIRARPAIAHLPIVALTADAMEDQAPIALAAGMDAFLSKPFEVTAAIALIRRLTGRGEARPFPPSASGSAPAPAETGQAASAPPAADWPGLALDRALTLWDDPAVYRRYLRRFADSYATTASTLAGAEPEAARQLAHKLKGTAGNLALVEVAARAAELEQFLRSDAPQATAERDDLVAALGTALDTALDSIARFAADAPASPREPERTAVTPLAQAQPSGGRRDGLPK